MEDKILLDEHKYSELIVKEIKYHELEERIDNAIEYIKNKIPFWEEWHYDGCIDTEDMNKIINILKGDDL